MASLSSPRPRQRQGSKCLTGRELLLAEDPERAAAAVEDGARSDRHWRPAGGRGLAIGAGSILHGRRCRRRSGILRTGLSPGDESRSPVRRE